MAKEASGTIGLIVKKEIVKRPCSLYMYLHIYKINQANVANQII